MLGGMGERFERTYSAPFALKSFEKQDMKDANGVAYRDFPLLEHARAPPGPARGSLGRCFGKVCRRRCCGVCWQLPGGGCCSGFAARQSTALARVLDHAGRRHLPWGMAGQHQSLLPCAGHRSGRRRCGLPEHQRRAHRGAARHPGHPDHVAYRRDARRDGGVLQGLGGRRGAVPVHHPELHSRAFC